MIATISNRKLTALSLLILALNAYNLLAIESDKPTASLYRAGVQEKPWGREFIFAAIENKYVGKVIEVKAGHSLSLQYHHQKDETISLLVGEALIEYGDKQDALESIRFVSGDTIHLPAGVIHRVTAVSDIAFVEASTAMPGWQQDIVRLEDKYGREGTSQP